MLKEFSKKILAVVMLCWLAGVIYGAVLIWESPEFMGEYLSYISTPTAVAIGFYSWKAKNENIRKYSQEQTEKIERLNH